MVRLVRSGLLVDISGVGKVKRSFLVRASLNVNVVFLLLKIVLSGREVVALRHISVSQRLRLSWSQILIVGVTLVLICLRRYCFFESV